MSKKRIHRTSCGCNGGLIEGETHENGGVEGVVVTDEKSPVELEDQEIIVNAETSTSDKLHEFDGEQKTPREIISDLNVEGGGVPIYKQGGVIREDLLLDEKDYKYLAEQIEKISIFGETGTGVGLGNTNKGGEIRISKSVARDFKDIEEAHIVLTDIMSVESPEWVFNVDYVNKDHIHAYPRHYKGSTMPKYKKGGTIQNDTLLLSQNEYNSLKNILNHVEVFGQVDNDVFIKNTEAGAEITISDEKASEYESELDALCVLTDILVAENKDWYFSCDYNYKKGIIAYPKSRGAVLTFKSGGLIESGEPSIFKDKFFEHNPGKLLGEQITVSTRFGKNATNYKGGLELLDKIKIAPEYTSKVRNGKKLGGNAPKKQGDLTEPGPQTEELNIDAAIEHSMDNIARKTIEKNRENEQNMYDLPTGESILSFEQVYNYVNPDGTKLNNLTPCELESFIWYQDQIGRSLSAKWYKLIGKQPTSRAFNNEDSKRWMDNGAVFYEQGQLKPAYLYLSGDLYFKKSLLEGSDKNNIITKFGETFWNKQMQALENVFAEMYESRLRIVPTIFNDKDEPVNKLTLKAISDFAKKFTVSSLKDENPFQVIRSKAKKTYDEPNFEAERNSYDWNRNQDENRFSKLSLLNAFIYWLKFYPSNVRYKKSGVSWQTIKDYYLQKKQYNENRDHDRGNYKRKCAVNQTEGERLFDVFLQQWIKENDQKAIETQWNNKFFGHRQIDYDKIPFALSCTDKELDGSPIEFRFEKRDAVAFTFAEGTGLLAYQVGMGKTRSAILTIGQFMDAGYSKRPVIVVPNQTYKQWLAEIRHLLPQYKINDLYNLSKDYLNELRGKGEWVLKLTNEAIDPKLVFEKDGVKYYGKSELNSDLLTDVAEFNDIEKVESYTITVLTYEGFKRIGFTEATQRALEWDMWRILEQGEEIVDLSSEKSKKDHESKKEAISADIGRALQGREVNIEDLGLDYLTLDEAHSAKKVFTRIKGEIEDDGNRGKNNYAIESGSRSAMALKTFCISQYIQRQNDGNNIQLLTATPFTNSPLEVFSMLALVSYQKLKGSDLESLQTFFNNYVQVENQLTINSKLIPERKDVFVGYNNLTALQALIGRFMSYKEAGKPDRKGRTIELKRPDKWILPLKYDVKGSIKSLLPPDEQIKTNLPLSGLQEEIMTQVRQYVEAKISLDQLIGGSIDILESLGINKVNSTEQIESEDLKIYTKTELKALSVDELLKVIELYGFDSAKFKKAKKAEIVNYIKDNEPDLSSNELVDTESVEMDESELDDDEKAGVKVLRGVNYARSLALSPYLYFESLFKNSSYSIPVPDYKSYIETSPKLLYTIESIKSVKQYHETKGEPVSGQIIYADRGKDKFHLIKEYLVKELGYEDHEVGMITSGSKKDEIKNAFNGQTYDEAKGKFINISDEMRMKVVIGSSSILEGINLQRYTTCLYNLFLPWNPTDVEQLIGRAWRQGNVFEDLRIINPLMDNSMDIFMFQKLEEKTERINQIWNTDGNSNAMRLEEFNPVELKKELITDPYVLAKIESDTEGEHLAESEQELSNLIYEAEEVINHLGMLDMDDYGMKEMANEVNRYLDKQPQTPGALLSLFQKLFASKKDRFGNKVTISKPWQYDKIKTAQRSLKRLEKDFLAPNSLAADKDILDRYIEQKNTELNELNEYSTKINEEDYLQGKANAIAAERARVKYKPATVESRIDMFKSLNHLLSNREVVDQSCEKFNALDADLCPPLETDRTPKIDKKSIHQLEACLKELPQTKAMHTINGTDIYTPEREELHDKILDEIRKGAVCMHREQPIAILTGGLPGSGKSTFLNQYSQYLTSDKIFTIDADEVRTMLPEYKQWVNSSGKELKGWNADQTHKETSDIVAKLLEGCKDGLPCKFDILYDGTMNKVKNYIPLVKKIKSLGYKTFIIFIQVPPEVTRERVLQRYKKSGRYVPKFVIENGIKVGLTVFDTLKTMVDGYMLVDGETREVIETKGEAIPKDRNYFDSEPSDPKQKAKELSKVIEGLWKKYA